MKKREIQKKQQQLSRKNQGIVSSSSVCRSNLATQRMASIKTQQGAYAKKGQKSKLAAERMSSIKAQQEAFAKKGQKTEEDSKEGIEEAASGIESKFGTTWKPKSTVRERMEELERKHREEAKKIFHRYFRKLGGKLKMCTGGFRRG